MHGNQNSRRKSWSACRLYRQTSVEERPGAYAITYEQQGFESTLCLFALLGRAVRNSHVHTNPIRRRDAQAHEQGNRRDG